MRRSTCTCLALAVTMFAAAPANAAPAPGADDPTATQAPAATPSAVSTEAPVATAPAPAAAPTGNIDVVNGSVGYRTQPGATTIDVYEGGQKVYVLQTPCAISAMTLHENFLYAGCSDGQLHLFAADGERARAPQHSGSYRYANPIRAFLIDRGQFVVDAPAPAPPAAAAPTTTAPPPMTAGASAAAAGPVRGSRKSQAQRDAELREAMRTKEEKARLNLGRNMMIGGFGGFGLAYGLSLYVGLVTSTFDGEARAWYLVPAVGPFVSAANSFTPGLDVFMGLTQVAALSVGAAGAGIYNNEKKRMRMQVSGLHLNRGAGLQLRMQF